MTPTPTNPCQTIPSSTSNIKQHTIKSCNTKPQPNKIKPIRLVPNHTIQCKQCQSINSSKSNINQYQAARHQILQYKSTPKQNQTNPIGAKPYHPVQAMSINQLLQIQYQSISSSTPSNPAIQSLDLLCWRPSNTRLHTGKRTEERPYPVPTSSLLFFSFFLPVAPLLLLLRHRLVVASCAVLLCPTCSNLNPQSLCSS